MKQKRHLLATRHLLSLLAVLTASTAWADSAFSGGSGTQAAPYQIASTTDLNQLATDVNGGNDYSGKYFRLGADIAYTYTTAWNDASSTENNFEAIGVYYNDDDRYFKGNFDGDGHTISGIRIHRSGTADADNYQGIFGRTKGATIHGIRLTDARITGYDYTGGIVGHAGRTVTDCHVANNVCIHAVKTQAWYHGGIVGYNNGTVASCTSAATLTIASDASRCQYYGAIAGLNSSIVTLRDNLAIGATVPAAYDNLHGAIAGSNNGTLQHNYYTACTVAEVANATGKGCHNADVATNDGAVPALRDDADNTHAIALLAALAQMDADRPVLPLDLGWGTGQFPLQLAGRTLTKDGNWNTLCLPFGVDNFSGTPLEGATVKTLDAANSNLAADGTLTLKFTEAASIEAGKPYIVKWESASGTVADPVFNSVTISSTAPTAVDFGIDGSTDKCQFVGQFSPFSIVESGATGSDQGNLNEIILMGSGSTLGYSKAERTLKSFRAHFYVPANGSTANVRAFVLDFGDGDNTTGIISINADNSAASADGWHDLNGRRLNGQPTQKGVYIVNGKKVVIK